MNTTKKNQCTLTFPFAAHSTWFSFPFSPVPTPPHTHHTPQHTSPSPSPHPIPITVTMFFLPLSLTTHFTLTFMQCCHCRSLPTFTPTPTLTLAYILLLLLRCSGPLIPLLPLTFVTVNERQTHTHACIHTHNFVHVYACFFYANLQNYISLWFCFCLCRHHCNPFTTDAVWMCVCRPSCAWPSLLLCRSAIYALEHSSESLVQTHTSTHYVYVCVYCVYWKAWALLSLGISNTWTCVCVSVCACASSLSLSPLDTFWHAVALT